MCGGALKAGNVAYNAKLDQSHCLDETTFVLNGDFQYNMRRLIHVFVLSLWSAALMGKLWRVLRTKIRYNFNIYI